MSVPIPNRLFRRRVATPVRCGAITIGGESPISIQTMTMTDTRDVDATVAQIRSAVEAGADIVRVAVLDQEAAGAIRSIKRQVTCPIVADIHFDYRLAIAALESGADKVRVNPGNFGDPEHLLKVALEAKRRGASIRLGVNSGSVGKEILKRFGSPCPEAIVQSAVESLSYLEDRGASGIVLSLKSSSVPDTVKAYALMAEKTAWPFHIGITESGPGVYGVIKSSAGIGALLALGLGDTVRVSLSGPCEEEVKTAQEILQAAGAASFRPDIISCPTCGRTQVDLIPVIEAITEKVKGLKAPLKIAIMGCPVNGPGEAREADLGIACARDGGILFAHGQILRRVGSEEMIPSLLNLIDEEIRSRGFY